MKRSRRLHQLLIQSMAAFGIAILFLVSPVLAKEPSPNEAEAIVPSPFKTELDADGTLHLVIQTRQATVELDSTHQILHISSPDNYLELPLADPDGDLRLTFGADQLHLSALDQLQVLNIQYDRGEITLQAKGRLQLPAIDVSGPLTLNLDGSLNGQTWQAQSITLLGQGLVNLNGVIQAPEGFISTVAAKVPASVNPNQLDFDPPSFVLTRQARINSPFILINSNNGWLNIQGQLQALQTDETGGQITLLGKRLHLLGATLDASGANGGGQILLGGAYKGLPLDIANWSTTYPVEDINLTQAKSQVVFIGEETQIIANALDKGSGGEIIVWSEESSRVYGQLSVLGGPNGGDGGFVETSSYGGLDLTTAPNTAALNGLAGEWLIDPFDTELVPGGGNTNINNSNPFLSTGETAQLGVDLITTGLGSGDVSVSTGAGGSQSGVITLTTTLDFNGIGNSGRTLTLNAHDMIVVDGQILDSSGSDDSLNVVINADSDNSGQGRVVVNQTINSGGGDVDLTGRSVLSSAILITNSATIRSQGGEIRLAGTHTGTSSDRQADHRGIFMWDNSTLDADSGTIRLTGTSSGLDGVFGLNNVALTGTLYITGTSTGTDSGARGVFFRDNAALTGAITLVGISSGGDGIFFHDNASLLSTSGNTINITGIGNGTDGTSSGIQFNNDANLSGGAITLNGTGGAGDTSNEGIFFNNSATLDAGNNAINLTGVGKSDGTGFDNTGIYFNQDATLSGATITLNGTGGSGTNTNRGIFFSSGAALNAGSNAINLTGVGNGTGNNNTGIHFEANSALDGAAITLNGTGGSGIGANRGIYLGTGTAFDAGSNTISLTGVGNGTDGDNSGIHFEANANMIGTLTLNGTGGAGSNFGNYGIFINNNGNFNAGNNTIQMTGLSNGTTSSSNSGIHIESTVGLTGTLTLNGTGGVGNSSSNYGVFINSNANLNAGNNALNISGVGRDDDGIFIGSNSSLQAGSNTINMTGVTTGTNTNSDGIFISSDNILAANSITLDGTSGTGSDNRGVFVNSNGSLNSSGTTINITGLSNGTGNNSEGIHFSNDATLDGSAITLNGTGGTGTDYNRGIFFNSTATLDAGSNAIGLTGVGNGTGTDNAGIHFNSDPTLNGLTITLNGTSGSGTDANRGIFLGSRAALDASSNTISLTGVGNGTGRDNSGIHIEANANMIGTLTLNGTSGAGGTGSNYGIFINNTANFNAGSNTIQLTGLSNSTGTSNGSNSGIHIESTAGLTGTLTLNGTGGVGNGSSYGIFINSNANFNTGNNALNMSGVGRDDDGIFIGYNGKLQAGTSTINMTGVTTGTNGNSDGIFINTDNKLAANSITLDGTSGTGSASRGVFIDSRTDLDSSSTTIDITGLSNGASGFANDGVFVAESVLMTGTMSLSGTGGSGTSARGVFINDGAHLTTTGTDIQLDGSSTNSNGLFVGERVQINSSGGQLLITGTSSFTQGIVVDQDSVVQSGSGNMILTADRLNIHGDPVMTDTVTNVPSFVGTGVLIIHPLTPSTDLTLGGGTTHEVADSNYLSDRELATLANGFSQIIIGRDDGSGAITLANTLTFSDSILLRSPSGAGTIDTNGFDLTGADNASVSLLASQDVTAGNISTMVSSGNAGNVELTSLTGNVTAVSIDTRATGGGNGGTVQVTADQFVRLTGQVPSTAHSISTEGAANTSAITIKHGGFTTTPFIVGDAATNGSAGSLTTGDATIATTQSFLGNYHEPPNIWIFAGDTYYLPSISSAP